MKKAKELLSETRARGLSALDARLLLQAAAGISHEDLIAEPDTVPALAAQKLFQNYVERRLLHEPVSRILGEREFFGRQFRVTPDVLDPRADTECVVQLALDLVRGDCSFLDIGTGSGAIAVTLAAERAQWHGTALDVSPAALTIAQDNARAHAVLQRVQFVQGDWFPFQLQKFDLIISNPPYIPRGDIDGLSPDVRLYDPLLALTGGEDGLEPYRIIARKAAQWLESSGVIVLEIGAGQEMDVETVFAARGFVMIEARRDLGGHVRGLAFNLAASK